MRALVAIAALALLALPAAAQVQCCYSWEDGGTILGYYGNVVDATNVTGPQSGLQGTATPSTIDCPGAYDGTHYLHVAEEPHSGTPYPYIAWVTGLVEGDLVTASYYGYENTAGGSPSMRIWAHYTPVGGDVNSYGGSASGPAEYTDTDGWDQVTNGGYTWTFASSAGANDGLVIEARLYSTPSSGEYRTDYFIDYICVEAPSHACVHFPQPVSPVEEKSWTTIKALYR